MAAMSGTASSLTGCRPKRYVISLGGTCCRCGTAEGQPCGSCSEPEGSTVDCSYFHGYFEVIQDRTDPDRYIHRFPESAPGNAQTLELRLNSDPSAPPNWMHVCVVITFGPDAEGNPVRHVSWGKVTTTVCEIGTLRRRSTNPLCCWAHKITVSPDPVPDYVVPQPDWIPGDPDDLNGAPFWPAIDFDLMEDGDFAPIRYANGELQLRIKDISSEGFGVPWGHTRIYSHRLSNSCNYGNGYNWMIHEWPRLVVFKTPLASDPPGVKREPKGRRTGCTIAMVRGTRNVLWFDETIDSGGQRRWEPRFASNHVLKHDREKKLFRVIAPNGQVWEFFDFTPPCSRAFQHLNADDRAKIAPGCLRRHLGPYGEPYQELKATYRHCRIRTMERLAGGVSETFTYEWDGELLYRVVLSRGGVTCDGEPNVSRVTYKYYGPGDPHGNPNDLKTVQVEFWDGSEWRSRPETLQYYAYYKGPNSTYCQGMLKAVIGPEAYHRMLRETKRDPVDYGPDIDYCDLWIDYYSDEDVPAGADERTVRHLVRRVKTLVMDRNGRLHTYEYRFSRNPPTFGAEFCKTIEYRPDDTSVTVDSNVGGETISHTLNGDGKEWKTEIERLNFRQPRNVYPPSVYSKGSPERPYLYLLCSPETSNLLGVWRVGGGTRQQGRFFYLGRRFPDDVVIWTLSAAVIPGRTVQYKRQWYGGAYAAMQSVESELPAVPGDQHGSDLPASAKATFNRFGFVDHLTDERNVETTIVNFVDISLPKSIAVNPREVGSLVTEIDADRFGRVTRVLGPWHPAITRDGATATELVRRAAWTSYDDLAGVAISSQGYFGAGGEQLINPVQKTVIDRSGRPVQQAAAVASNTNSPRRLRSKHIPRPTWCRLATVAFDRHNRPRFERVYCDIAEDRFAERRYVSFDPMFRPTGVLEPDGTSVETHYDPRGLALGVAMGVRDVLPVVAYQYDEGGVGNGRLTSVERFANKWVSRVTLIAYNGFDEPVKLHVKTYTKSYEDGLARVYVWDPAGRVSQAELRSPVANSWQIPHYDARGNIYRIEHAYRANRDPQRVAMTDLIWRDQVGAVVKRRPAGGLGYFKIQYDSLGRERTRAWAFGELADVPIASAEAIYDWDNILEQTNIARDSLGQPRRVVLIQAGPIASDKTPTVTSGGRTSTSEVFYDPLGRIVAEVDYGAAQVLERPAVGGPAGIGLPAAVGGGARDTIPPCTDFVLVNRYSYNERGELHAIEGPDGRLIKYTYDDAGRITIESAQAFQRTTVINYHADGRVESVELIDLWHNQRKTIARYLYGTGLASDNVTNSLPTTMFDAEGRTTRLSYNRQGEIIWMEDPRGVCHEYFYDEHGRIIRDSVTSFGEAQSNVDSRVRGVAYRYDSRGRVVGITNRSDGISSDSKSTETNRKYSAFDQVAEEATSIFEEVVGELHKVDAATVTLRYLHEESIGVSLNTIRPALMTYPSGKLLQWTHATGADTATGRVTYIRRRDKPTDPSHVHAAYLYWGAAKIYQVRLDGVGQGSGIVFNLEFPSGTRFAALDSFDRIRTLRWLRNAGRNLRLRLDYKYDRRSLREHKILRIGDALPIVESYKYDPLGRLECFHRAGGAAESQTWKLDASGNWREWEVRGSETLHQTREPSAANQIESIANLPNEPQWRQPAYDAAGNMTAFPLPTDPTRLCTVRYDAWNRPVELTWGENLVELTYDGLGRLVFRRRSDLSGVLEECRFTYSPNWQLLEEQISPSSGEPYRFEYVWGIRGPNDLVCREKYQGNLLLERQYALSDAIGNVVGIVPTVGGVSRQSVLYDPYGRPLSDTGDFQHLFGGYYHDRDTGLYFVRNRVYHPTLGCWLTHDPLGFVDGPNLYEYALGNPVMYIDPSGEAVILGTLLALAIYGALAGAGIGIIVYTANAGLSEGGFKENFSWRGLGYAAAIGAFAGAASAVTGGLAAELAVAGGFSAVGATFVSGAVAGATGGFIHGGFAEGSFDIQSALAGAAIGGISGGIGGAVFGRFGGRFIPGKAPNRFENVAAASFGRALIVGAGSGATTGAVSGGFGGYIRHGWEGVLPGAVSGAAQGALLGAASAGISQGFFSGREYRVGGSQHTRIAFFGNRTQHQLGELPHYHRQRIDPLTGKVQEGQGSGLHRPWELRNPIPPTFWATFWRRF